MSSDIQSKIYPSILGADIGYLAAACEACVASGGDGIHLDIMDGVFVPNISFGPEVARMARRVCPDAHLNTHLMVARPDQYADVFMDAGVDTLLFHVETEVDHLALLKHIRSRGVRAGITLNPDTELDRIAPLLDEVDEVLFMTVFPGFGGQAFIPEPMERMRALRQARPTIDIAVDGGVNHETAKRCAAHGANVFDVGSFFFKMEDMAAGLVDMRRHVSEATTTS